MKKPLSLCLLAFVAVTLFAQAPLVSGAVSTVAGLATTATPLDSLKGTIRNSYGVMAGDTLRMISAREFGDYRYWPLVFMTNTDVVTNPERIEPATEMKIYKLPFASGTPDGIARVLIAETYIQTYERYVALGADWIDERRWVLLEALYFEPELFDKYAGRVDADDAAWYKARP